MSVISGTSFSRQSSTYNNFALGLPNNNNATSFAYNGEVDEIIFWAKRQEAEFVDWFFNLITGGLHEHTFMKSYKIENRLSSNYYSHKFNLCFIKNKNQRWMKKIFCSFLLKGSIQMAHYRARFADQVSDQKVSAGIIASHADTPDAMACRVLCARNPFCVVVNWSQAGGVCEEVNVMDWWLDLEAAPGYIVSVKMIWLIYLEFTIFYETIWTI